ncbi:MAG TPA: sialidase family protein [Nitrososphaeraceae archaeon]|nr:sialidase family protein [Nitrososphaeraceae archaeon]
MFIIPFQRTRGGAIKEASVLILIVVITTVQIAAAIVPLQPVEAQDTVFDPPPSQNPAPSTGAGVNSAPIINPTGLPPNSTIITNSSGTPVPSISINGTGGNATAPLGGNETAPLGGNETAPLGGNVTGGFGGAGTGGFDNATGGFGGGPGTEGLGGGGPGTEGLGGGLNETLPGAAAPPPITTILSNNTGDSTNPNVAISGSTMFVAWEDTTGGNREILTMISSDGQNFTTVQNISRTPGDSLNPKLAVSGKNVYVVWEDINDTGSGQIMFAKSSDSGATFTNARNLDNSTGDSTNPNIAVSGNNVYIVWEHVDTNSTAGPLNSEVMFAKSSDSGATFTNARNLSNNTGDSTNPNIAVSGNNVYIVWEDDTTGGAEIILVRSTNNGVNFVPARNMSNSLGESSDPRIAVSGSNVYVVWVDYSLGNSTNSDIMLMRSINGGANFASAENLSNSPGQSSNPRIAVSENNVYVVWEDTASETGNGEVKFVRSADSGATFTSAKNLSNNNGISFDPRIAVSENNVYVVWEDTTATTTGGSSDIFLARSTNNGVTFGKVQNLSNSPVESFSPNIAASRSKLFVLWSDDKAGDAEIIFTDKTRNIASPEEGGVSAGGAFGTTPDQSLTGGGAFGTTPDQSLTGGGGGGAFGTTPDQSLTGGGTSAGGGAFGTTPDQSLTGGGALGTTPDQSLQGGSLPPVTQ